MKKLYFLTSVFALTTFVCTNVQAQMISTFMGNGLNTPGGSDGGQHSTCSIRPFGIFIDLFGNVVVSDYTNHRIRELFLSTTPPDTNVVAIAGSASSGFSGDGSNANSAQLNLPAGIWCNYTGDTILFCDAANNAIRMLAKTGLNYTIYTIVNTSGTSGYSGDGAAAASAKLNSPQSVWRDAARNIYIADQGNHCIRKVDRATGFISTLAGTGTSGSSGDGGLANVARLNLPTGVFVDSTGDVFIADYGNNKIRKIDHVSGNISTVVDTSGVAGNSGDGAAAVGAKLNGPSGVFVYAGKMYIADKGNNKIRVVNSSGVISTLAGTGTAGNAGDGGPAVNAQLSSPTSVFVNNSGIYISDYGNLKVRMVELPNAVTGPQLSLNAQIFPNPSTGEFTIELPSNAGKVNAEVYNVVGASVYSQVINAGKTKIDLSAQATGVYFIHLRSGDAVSVQKIVLNK